MTLPTAIALTCLSVSFLSAQTNQTSIEAPTLSSDKTRTSLHQEVDFKASPQRIYEILLDSKQFSAFSGGPAQISPEAGAAFPCSVEESLDETSNSSPTNIVQTWPEAVWPPGVYSLVKFELKEQGSKTRVILDHTGFEEGDFVHLNPGWKSHYWDPLEKFFGDIGWPLTLFLPRNEQIVELPFHPNLP